MRYAAKTKVSVDRSKAEIEKTLKRYGVGKIICGESAEDRLAYVMFEYAGTPVRIPIDLPDPQASCFWHSPERHLKYNVDRARREYDQACQQRWRVALLWLKAQLEAIEAKFLTAQEAFMVHTITKSGATIGQIVLPQLASGINTSALALPFGKEGA